MCFNYFFKKKYGITKPVNTKIIDGYIVKQLLRHEFGNVPLDISDKKFKTTDFSEYIRFLDYDLTDKNIYVSEWFDCDDFSVMLHGNITIPYWSALAFGELWVRTPNGGHAVNMFIDNDQKVWIVEPQNDRVFKMPDNWEAYRVEM